jgi:very-short-patch-repair endonuclease/predicted  nucleic acid-binding Zn-ribbon protein
MRKLTNEIIDTRLKGRPIQRLGDVTHGKAKTLFKCLIDGYEWMTTPSEVSKGHGCPKCAGTAHVTNEIMDERLKDRPIQRLGDVTTSKTKVLWKCTIDGHEWMASPNDISMGKGCPKCGKLMRKQASQARRLTNEIMDKRIKNRPIVRLGEVVDTETCVLWKCTIDGLEWMARPNDISKGKGCPKCAGKLPITNEIMDERLKDKQIQRLGNIINSGSRILFRCLVDGHEWMATPSSVSYKSGCPKCAGNLPLTNERVDERIADMHIRRLGNVVNSGIKIAWKCLIDGHEWVTCPTSILQGYGCPRCASSLGEQNIFEFLDRHKITYVHQKKFEECRNIRPLPFDFYIDQRKLLIEYQGEQHFRPVFGSSTEDAQLNFEERQRHDAIKKAWAADNGYQLLYFTYKQTWEEIKQELKRVLIDPLK